jgi:hypothetical protein
LLERFREISLGFYESTDVVEECHGHDGSA